MTQDIEKVIGEAAKDAGVYFLFKKCKVDFPKARQALTTTLTKVAEESRQLGRNEILEEWNHDQRKLLDGFNHPKDCKLCEQPILCKQCELEGNAGVCDRKHCKNYKND